MRHPSPGSWSGGRGHGQPALGHHVAHDVGDPVAVGPQRQVRRAGPAQGPAYRLPLLRGRGGVPRPQPAVPGRDLAPVAGLRVDERDHADVRQLQLARVGDLDGEDLVAGAEAA